VRTAIPFLVLLAVLFAARPALAVNAQVEDAAKKALKKAESDYLSMNYAAGIARLKKAAAACGERACTPGTKATLVCDLATMLFRNGDKAGASKAWKIAAKLKPDVTLNPAYDQPDVSAAFLEATVGPAPTGDFSHTPPAEQKVDTPLPVYFEGGSRDATRAVVFYRLGSFGNWKSVELTKMGSGWGGVIPCGDVQPGFMRYYIQAFDHRKSVGGTGDGQHAFVVPIRADIAGPAPHLPGKPPPKSCAEGGDESKGADESGKRAGERGGDRTGATEKDENEEGEGEPRKRGEKRAASSAGLPFRRFWLGAAFGLDFMVLPSGNDLCKLDVNIPVPTNPDHMYCTTPDGADFPSHDMVGYNLNNNFAPGQAGESNGGVARANARIMLSADYAVTKNLLVGARAGIVLFTYPGQAAVIDGRTSRFGMLHLEGRGTWVFGENPLASAGLAPMVFAGGGISHFDASTSANVSFNNGSTMMVDIWKTDGPAFGTAGGGIRWAPVAQLGVTVAARVNLAFGNGPAWTFGPEVGVAYGF
jgi:hypothetical protein